MRTRGARGTHYTLITPGNHYTSRLPNLPRAEVYKLVTPRLAPARIGQYLVVMGDEMAGDIRAGFENFLFGLAGRVRVRCDAGEFVLEARSYAYVPASSPLTLEAQAPGRLLWIKRRYQPWPGLDEPGAAWGHAADVTAEQTTTPGLHRRELVDPADPARDFTMSLMAFKPRAELSFVEIHDEEHGLYMTAGGGDYVLDGDEHRVMQDDFIYMAPYCPQWFRAGEEGAEYLLYKDVYRDGF